MVRYFLDTLGQLCPVPLLRAEEQVKAMTTQDVLVLETDHNCTVRLLPARLKRYHCQCRTLAVADGVWQIEIQKKG